MSKIFLGNSSILRRCLMLSLVFIMTVLTQAAPAKPKLIDLDFKNADLKDVLRVLAAQEGANFLIDNEVSGTVTIHLTKVTFIDALNVIAQTNNLVYTKENNVFHITQPDNSTLTVEFNEGMLTLESKNAKLTTILKTLSQKTGANFVPAGDLKERVTISLNNLPLENALAVIAQQAGCTLDKDGLVTVFRKDSAQPLPFKLTYQNNLLSIDAQNTPLAALTRAITEKTGVTVVPNQDLSLNVNIFIQNLPLEDALSILCSSNNLQLAREGDSWRIARSVYSATGQNTKIEYDRKNETFSLEVQSSPVSSIISEMGRKANINLVINAEVNWTINNVRLRNLKFPEVLDYILRGTIFTYKLIGDTYVIGDGLMIRPENSYFSNVKIYPIKYLKADQVLNTLPPIFPRQCFVLMLDKNSLIVSGTPAIHKLFADYLDQVDTESNGNQTEVIKIKYLKAEDILKYIPASIPKNDLVVIKETNSITVTGPQNLINQVKQYIEKIDQINPMIIFDIMVVSIQDSNGTTWSPPSGAVTLDNGNELRIGPSIPTISYNKPESDPAKTLIASLTALISKGKAKVLSNPTITTLNGYPTNFSVSTKRVYSIQTTSTDSNGKPIQTYTDKNFDSGLYITITPWVSADKITMEIKPKISDFGAAPDKTNNIPETYEHATETTIRVNNKETVIISGLKTTHKTTNVSKVPILGDIPLLGYLFKSTSIGDTQEEFVVVITPRLVYDQSDQTEAIEKTTGHFSPDTNAELDRDLKAPREEPGEMKGDK